MSITTTQSGRIWDISQPSATVEFNTDGLDSVTFQAMLDGGASAGSLVLTVQVQLGGLWSAVPAGAVTVSNSGVVTSSVSVVSPVMRVYASTAGSSGGATVYMHGRTAV